MNYLIRYVWRRSSKRFFLYDVPFNSFVSSPLIYISLSYVYPIDPFLIFHFSLLMICCAKTDSVIMQTVSLSHNSVVRPDSRGIIGALTNQRK